MRIGMLQQRCAAMRIARAEQAHGFASEESLN
jgi:hypothetical protein